MEKNLLISIILFSFFCRVYKCWESPINKEIMINNGVDCLFSNKAQEPNNLLDYENKILNEELNKEIFNILKPLRFFNNNPELIYIFESNSTDIKILDPKSKGLSYLNFLEYGSNLTVDSESYSGEIRISSIPNTNVYLELLTEKNYDKLFLWQKFTSIKFIQTDENNLIANFDSFDDNNKVYYAKYKMDILSPKDIYPINKNKFNSVNIKEQIITLECNSTYIIIYDVTEYYLSSLELFITQKENENQDIYLHENEEKYLYLNKGKTYQLKLENINNYRIMKLSSKTINSKIIIGDNNIIDKENKYFKLERNKDIKIKIENDDALIEFLYYFENEIIIDSLEKEKEKLESKSELKILIKLGSPDDYTIKLESDSTKSFGTSIYGKLGSENYHYFSEECLHNLIYGFSFEETIKKDAFKNINTKGDEYYMIYLYIEKQNSDIPLYLTINPTNLQTLILKSSNFSSNEYNKAKTYKYIIEGDQEYTFRLYIDDKNIESYYPLYTFENRTNYNEKELTMKNEGNNNNTHVYLNYYKNWAGDDEVNIMIIAGRAKNILLVIYILAGILIFVCFAIVVLALRKIIKKQKEVAQNQDNELLIRNDD